MMTPLTFLAVLVGCAPGERVENPWIGEQRAAIVLLAWADEPPTLPREAYEEAFLGEVLSLSAYLWENSQGTCELTGEVFEWRSTELRWADQDHDDPKVVARAAREAFGDVLEPAGFDADGNGRIDHLFVVHSGRTEQDRPNPRHLFPADRADFSVVLQSQGVGGVGEELAIGIYLHEAGHQYFDQYDLYGNYQHGRYGIGVWGIMGLGAWGPNNGIPLAELFRYPVHFRAAAKEQIGWMALRTLDTTTLDLRLDPIEIGGEGLRIPGAGADLVLEVRGPIGFSSGLPCHGLLIWREDWFPLSELPVIRLV
ncbi:MAG: hypothetical protein JRJ84_17510, partial [Deltaproteobacteria bacterium]|nr:hypothetical protein [Deltaproteobacteria bacterium]